MNMYTINEIFRTIYRYTSRGKVINSAGLENIINLVVRQCGLNDYLETLTLKDRKDISRVAKERDTNDNVVVYAGYSKYKHNVVLYLDNIEKAINDFDDVNLSDEEKVFRANIEIVGCLLHEVNHACQRLNFMNRSGSELENLYYLSFDFDLLKKKYIRSYYDLSLKWWEARKIVKSRNKVYHKTYSLNPCERIADIRALETIVNHFRSLIDNKYKRVADIEYAKYLEALIAGYDRYDESYTCPTHHYLSEVKLDEVWEKTSFYDPNELILIHNVRNAYPLEKRLEYGLPVFRQELAEFKDRIEQTNSRIRG